MTDTENNVIRLIRAGSVRTVNGASSEKLTVTKLDVAFDHPTGLASDEDGNLYVTETGNDRIVKIEDGKMSAVASGFDAPQGVAVGGDGSIYVADTGNGAVKKISGGTVTTLASRDPSELNGGLTSPVGLLVQGGKLYICDPFARKVFVYQI